MATETPWQRARKSQSELQEERLGRMEGGERSVNSGRFWRWKRDGRLREFIVEARTTDKKSYSIQKEEWQAIRREAFKTPPGLLPSMQIDIQDVSLFVMELTAFQDLFNELVALRGQVALQELRSRNADTD